MPQDQHAPELRERGRVSPSGGVDRQGRKRVRRRGGKRRTAEAWWAGGERKGEQRHFQLARETTGAGGPQCSAAFCPPLVSITALGFWQGEPEGEREERETPWLPPSAEAALCHPVLLFHLNSRQRRETLTSKGSLISEVHRSTAEKRIWGSS